MNAFGTLEDMQHARARLVNLARCRCEGLTHRRRMPFRSSERKPLPADR
jgi:hypothetical protein